MKILSLVLLFTLIACGKSDSSKSGESEDPVKRPRRTTPPVVIESDDMVAIAALRPTMYYTALEKNVSCRGKYGRTGPVYTGSERSNVLDRSGKIIANVCTRFLRVLTMEGSAILKDRGQGEMAVNYSGVVGGIRRFHLLDKCAYGEGVKPDLCLLPYHTLAADNKVHKIGDIIYMPKAKGLLLPDGTLHEGFFIVRDTGGAFIGVGGKRVDMFTGTDPDSNNVFLKAGFNHLRDTSAFKVKPEAVHIIRDRLKYRFGDLY